MFLTVALLCVLNALSALGQLSGRVGPTTSRSSKQAHICNVLNYGGSVGSSVRLIYSLLRSGTNTYFCHFRTLDLLSSLLSTTV